jgi:hypothetical protein
MLGLILDFEFSLNLIFIYFKNKNVQISLYVIFFQLHYLNFLFVNQNIDLNICLYLNWDFCEIKILKVCVGVTDFVCVHPK